MIRLSVLEQSAAATNRSHDETIRETVQLAPLCEDWGYHGYWLSEHHNSASLLGSAPEILIAAVAAVTRRIAVGAAGVMLSHYAPYKVAEQFRTLAALYPGRIRLGIGRSRSTEEASRALRTGSGDFVEEGRALLAFLGGDCAVLDESLKPIRAMPIPRIGPAPFCLATSENGARAAARLGLPLIFNYSDGANALSQSLALYRREFVPSMWSDKPHVSLSVWALVAPTSEEATYLFQSRVYWRGMLLRGQRVPMLPPLEAAQVVFSAQEQAVMAEKHTSYFVGTADEVAGRIQSLASSCDAEEILTTTWTYDPQLKRRSHQLLAQAMGLGSILSP